MLQAVSHSTTDLVLTRVLRYSLPLSSSSIKPRLSFLIPPQTVVTEHCPKSLSFYLLKKQWMPTLLYGQLKPAHSFRLF